MSRTDYFDDPAAPHATGRMPGVMVAVRDAHGRVLLTKRVDNGWWVLPGGLLDLGETIGQAAVREVLEETGITVEVVGFAGIYTNPGHIIDYGNGRVLQEFSVTLHARYVTGEARADGRETSEIRWFESDELNRLDLTPLMRRRLADALDLSAPPAIR